MPEAELAGLPRAGGGHPRVRQYVRIKRSGRGADRAVALEGRWAVGAAASASVPIEVVFVCPELLGQADAAQVVARVRRAGASVVLVSERTLCRMAERDGPDGVAAIARLPERRLSDLRVGDVSRVLVADSIGLAGNLGTLIRCADGAGAGAVLLTDGRVRIGHPLVVKASVATLFSMPVVQAGRPEALAWLRRHGFTVVAADPNATGSYRHAHYGARTAVVVGSERRGLDDFWSVAADVRVSVPMLGAADSLNVGHAAAVLLYEVLARHVGPLPGPSDAPLG